jgi:hypothetical protein
MISAREVDLRPGEKVELLLSKSDTIGRMLRAMIR